jgi:hypothetical protein
MPDPRKPWTWGGFMAYAESLGVTVETLPNVRRQDGTMAPLDYLERTGGDGALTFPLPMGYLPDRRLGPIALGKACKRLQIPLPPWPPAEHPRPPTSPA